MVAIERDPGPMSHMPSDSLPPASLEGVVDGLEGSVLRGWACWSDGQRAALQVEVHSDGACIGHAEASLFRADLAAAGKREGYCAFTITLDPLPPAGAVLNVTVSDRVHRKPLSASPFTVPEVAAPQHPIEPVDVLPLPLHLTNLQGSLDQCGPGAIRGWARWTHDSTHPVMLALHEGGQELARFEASYWRADLAELQDGDGCCGFEHALPAALGDGQLHTLDLRLADSEASLLQAPFKTRLSPAAASPSGIASSGPAPLRRAAAASRLTLSVVVNFYNMQREAERTLTSLGRDYQQGADELDYEVLCIDNGSTTPLDAGWIASFGPQFRLIRPSRQLSSPCAALNEAALQARGDYLAVMIDGAHLLTPGVLREASLVWREDAAAVVAVRHWFIGGDQRWLAISGYQREQEDRLFERIRWPSNGYDLFRIGAPIGENPEPWFDGLSESNCLILPTALFDQIGGFDERFSEPGGGFANLDFWRRASDAASGPLVSLIGEASFHQFHDGTTTNVDDAEKDVRVRAYANAYRQLRGADFTGVHRSRLSFRGHINSEFATGVRQRTLLPLRLGVTDRVRPGQLALHFDEGAQTHLQSVYAECGLHDQVTWLGLPTGLAPADLVSVQQIIHQLRPDAVIAAGAERGLVAFIEGVLQATNNPTARLLHLTSSDTTESSPHTTTLHGSSADADLLATARHWVGSAETVLVLYAADPGTTLASAAMRSWGALVSYRSWLICLGTLFGQPWLGYSTRQHVQVIREFTSGASPFVIDRSWNRQLLSTCPSGYLRKVGGAATAATYDATLDEPIPLLPLCMEHAR